MFRKLLFIVISFTLIFSCSKDSEPKEEPNLNSGDTLEQVSKTNTEAVSKLNELLGEGDLTSSLEKLKIWLESSPSILEANIRGGDVEIKYNSGLSSFLIISLVDEEGNKTKGMGAFTSKKNLEKGTEGLNKKVFNHVNYSNNKRLGGGGDVVIANRNVFIYDAFQFYFNTGEGQKIQDLFESSSLKFNVTYLKDEECTLNALNDLTDYGFVYFNTHGNDGNIIWTREKVDFLDIDRWSLYVSQKLKFGTFVEFEYFNLDRRKVEDKGSFWGITSNYISDLSGEFPNSIIFNSSCESTKSHQLYDAFKEKKAKTYLGFDKTVFDDFSKYVGTQFVSRLLTSPANTGDAFNGIPTKKDSRTDSDALIQILGEENVTFFGDVFRDPRDGQTYKTVTINGQTWMTQDLAYDVEGQSWPSGTGRYYTWEGAQIAAPEGWHLASDDEWLSLEVYLGLDPNKEYSTAYRGDDINLKQKLSEALNLSSNGVRINTGGVYNNGGLWWTSSSFDETTGYDRDIISQSAGVARGKASKAVYQMNIRCIKD